MRILHTSLVSLADTAGPAVRDVHVEHGRAILPRALLLLMLTLLLAALAGCITPPPAPAPAPERNPEDVELTLNLPEQPPSCECVPDPANDLDSTFLERGVQVLAAGEHIEAVQYFQRYQRLEQAPLAQWQARLAIAYVSMLPDSPFYDVPAARDAYRDLKTEEPKILRSASSGEQKHHSIVLMQQALESFVLMERHVEDLENREAMLREDLEKREQALKRLRELTLGQPANSP